MKIIFSFIVVCLLISCQNSTSESTLVSGIKQTPTPDLLSKRPILTWMRRNPVQLNCMLETELPIQDQHFNTYFTDCKTRKINPCDVASGYGTDINSQTIYEEIILADSIMKKVHPSIKEIKLNFEHGYLQELSFTFKDSILITDIKSIFNLPDTIPHNIISISYGENVFSKDKPVNPKYTRWLSIVGFEHMGAADVESE